ncbi:hypothetical protein [Rhizobium sp. BR 362]|uniref:hypothetical protein n=1 Tax=Rhizobium sp. BR 362 TaxID=3040670 RepID=UPI002F429602
MGLSLVMVSSVFVGGIKRKSDEARPSFGHKKRPRQEPAFRAWVLSPDGYAILPMRSITTTRTVAIVMTLQLDRNFDIVNVLGIFLEI